MHQQPIHRPQPNQPARRLPQVNLAQRIRAAQEAARNAIAPFAGAETRERWYNDNTMLYLHGATVENGQFGEQWVLKLSEENAENQPINLGLARNTYRDVFFEQLHDMVQLLKGPIGPFCLTKIVTASGQESWSLEAWSAEKPPDAPF